MYIAHGDNRLVIVFEKVVLKFPKIQFTTFWKRLLEFRLINEFNSFEFWSYRLKGFLFDPPHKDHPGLRYFLFSGISTNWNEFVFWRKTKHPFCLVTYFSFFGICNIQKTGTSVSVPSKEFWIFMKKCPNYDWRDGHHFSNPKNFSYEDGVLKILDYGLLETQECIQEFGSEIQEHFKLNVI